jgi:cytidyltransferase-like protein
MKTPRRALLLSACDAPGVWLTQHVSRLRQDHDEVVVAIDDANAATDAAPLPQRWAQVRSLLATEPKAWVTPLVRAVGLGSPSDQAAALAARLGEFANLQTDSGAWAQHARALGLEMQLLEPACPVPAERDARLEPARSEAFGRSTSRALVVTRAQPFHLGHLALVERALELADEVVVVIAAADRAFAARDPFSAGERLRLVRAGLGRLGDRVWLVALPAPVWPAMALKQLAFIAPHYDIVVGHNPVLRVLAAQEGKQLAGLEQLLAWQDRPLRASAIRQRLVETGAGDWLYEVAPEATARWLVHDPVLAKRCALIAAGD